MSNCQCVLTLSGEDAFKNKITGFLGSASVHVTAPLNHPLQRAPGPIISSSFGVNRFYTEHKVPSVYNDVQTIRQDTHGFFLLFLVTCHLTHEGWKLWNTATDCYHADPLNYIYWVNRSDIAFLRMLRI